jgi:transposase InsO family protein
MDVKKFGRFQAPGHALTADRTKRSPGAGWEYMHSIIDDSSRLAYSEIHNDETAVTVTAFTLRALDWFLEQGIACERLMTDNAFAYTQSKSSKQLLWRRAIQHIRTRPYTPRTNGTLERFHQTLMREWAYALEYASSDARAKALPHRINHYNERRSHSALGNQPPHPHVRDVTRHNN